MFRLLIKQKFTLTFICFIGFASSYSQTSTRSYGQVDVKIVKEKKPRKIYTKVVIKSDFIDGDSIWIQSLEKTLNQSILYKNRAKAGEYTISVDFILDKNGNILDIHCINEKVGFGMGEHVINAIRKQKKWVPAPPQEGIPVRTYRTSSATPAENLSND